jgi:transposase
MAKRLKRASAEREIKWEALPIIHEHAAGLDIGAAEIVACAPAEPGAVVVRAFGTFTPDLESLADWLCTHGVSSVAMESTGVYWIPAFEILEARGVEVYLVNARHIKGVPGRKTDVLDCQWLQRLHTYGLLSASFQPKESMRALRAYLRQRGMLLEYRAAHIQHMQKALHQMNLQLTQVLSDISGTTGLTIIRAIVAGQHDPVELARLRHPRCHSSEDEIAKALTGHYRPEHLFSLQQALELYDFYTAQLQACDRQLEEHYSVMKPDRPPEEGPEGSDPTDPTRQPPLGPDPKRDSHCKNAPAFDVRAHLYRIARVDLTVIPGLDDSSVQTALSETGTDMSKWRTDKHFGSWLHLAPHNDITGGKVRRSRTLPGSNRASQVFRLAAQTAGRGNSAIGAYYRQMRARVGAEQAIVATAYKIARIYYHMLKYHTPYQPDSADEYESRRQARDLKVLHRKAAKLGLELVPRAG